jgi:hypothetical protein
MSWLTPYWHRLLAGNKIEFFFPRHPQVYGFRRFLIAESVGQKENWALSLTDGSRLHLWLMPDGRWIMHRDAIDPARGPIEAVAHVVTESSVGKMLLVAGLAVGVGVMVSSARE